MKYAWITKHRDSFPVAVMCDVLDVSTSGYYASRRPCAEPAGPASRADRAAVRASARRVARHLRQRQDRQGAGRAATSLESACRNTVARAMREMGLKSRVSQGVYADHHAGRSDEAAGPQHARPRLHGDRGPISKWVTDITYLPTLAGWVYLAVVLDLFSRKVVGWSIGDSLATALVAEALRQAIEATPAGRQGAVASQRSRLPVHERRLPADLENAWASSAR